MAGLPVIATNVGDCKEVIINDDYGMLISSMHVEKLRTSIKYYINNKSDAEKKGKTLKAYTEENFLEKAVVNSILRVYESVISV
jgi:glycosyltransferase involved in cell wall biosynthesis